MTRAVVAALLLAAAPATAADVLPGPYHADVVSVYDGDTITARVHLWPGLWTETSVRLAGIDAPEIRGRCEAEKRQAVEARNVLETMLGNGPVTLRDVHPGKYAGRVVARVEAGGQDVGAELVRMGLARRYDGGRRDGWCE